jgi:dipeptidyl aminopeptidase/acylaminoacyl peptidase
MLKWLLGLALTSPAWCQPLTPEAFVQMRTYQDGQLSPEGETLAYTLSGQNQQVEVFERGEARMILEGASTPRWSPDGKALAMLEGQGSDTRLKVWWRNKGTWSVLRHASVSGSSFRWLDSQRLLVSVRLPFEEKKSVVVLESQQVPAQPRHRLLEWNPDSGSTSEWGEGVFGHLEPSPTLQKLAALRLSRLEFPNVTRANPAQELVVFDKQGSELTLAEIVNPKPDSLTWSADGKTLLVCDEQGGWWKVNGKAEKLPAAIKEARWLGNQMLTRSDLWRLADQPLLPASAQIVGQVALSEGRTYLLTEKGAQPCDSLPSSILRIESRSPLLVSSGQQRFLIDAQAKSKPAPSQGQLFAANGNLAWWCNPEHTQLSRSDGQSGPSQAGPQSNERLSQTAEGDWLLLPGPEKAAPYPTVVWLQPGQVYGSVAPSVALMSSQSGGLNARLLTARGYAVFFPNLGKVQGEPVQWLRASLPAALTRLRSNSNLDSNRLALLGEGLGGYATLLATTQGHPFKAAVALSATADLGSDYARFSPPTRTGAPQEALAFVHRQSHYYEKGPLSMELPPWQDPQRWVRNSPFFQAGAVDTPVLLVSGSGDAHLAQAEQFFNALYRQGKPARLVRYEGESQRISKSEHIVDEWRQIYFWLDRYLDTPVQANH